nr:uncharacterized protein LOC113810161 isoform X1 [Penaeus vannamei]
MADVAENNVDDEEVEDPLNSMIEEAIRNLQRNPNGSGGLAQTDQFSLIPAPPVSSAGSMESPSEIEFKGQRALGAAVVASTARSAGELGGRTGVKKDGQDGGRLASGAVGRGLSKRTNKNERRTNETRGIRA